MKLATKMWMVVAALAIHGTTIAGTVPAATPTAASASSGDKCIDNAQTQTAMDECASNSLQVADKELNQVYQQVLTKYASDKVFIAKLRLAQEAWITFRDAELEARYPASNKSGEYGSVYPMCADNELEAMTRQRIEELRMWLKSVKEGETCVGSYSNS